MKLPSIIPAPGPAVLICLVLVASHAWVYNWGAKHERTEKELTAATGAALGASKVLGAVVAKATDNAARDDRRDTLRQEADNDHTQRIRVLESDADRLRAERDSLRIAARAAGDRARGACAPGQAVEPGRAAASALEFVFEQCGSRYEAVALAADRAIAAGLKCQDEHAADETLTATGTITADVGSAQ